MRLLFLTPQLPFPPRQGATIRNFNLIRELADRHTVDLLSFLAPGERLTGDNPLFRICGRVAAVPQPVRQIARRALSTLLSPLPDMALRLESPAMHDLVTAWLTETTYDIVQIEAIELTQYGQRASQVQPGTAIVFDEHNCEYLLQQRAAQADLREPRRWIAAAYSLVQWQKLRRYEARALKDAAATIAVSHADRNALLDLVPGIDITVVSNGIDLAAFTPQLDPPPANPPRIVFTGKMDYRPNIDAVLWFGREVLPLVLAQEPDARFQIVGLNPHPRLDELRAHPAVEITGMVEDTRPFIYAAAAYVIPMRVGGGTRFKALEAMSSARAIVSTQLGVEGIPVQTGQELLLADTAVDFAAAVVRLITDARGDGQLQRELGRRARRFVEDRYGWPALVPLLEEVYLRVAGQ